MRLKLRIPEGAQSIHLLDSSFRVAMWLHLASIERRDFVLHVWSDNELETEKAVLSVLSNTYVFNGVEYEIGHIRYAGTNGTKLGPNQR